MINLTWANLSVSNYAKSGRLLLIPLKMCLTISTDESKRSKSTVDTWCQNVGATKTNTVNSDVKTRFFKSVI